MAFDPLTLTTFDAARGSFLPVYVGAHKYSSQQYAGENKSKPGTIFPICCSNSWSKPFYLPRPVKNTCLVIDLESTIRGVIERVV